MAARRELLENLLQTLDDGRVSRSERQALGALLAESPLDANTRAAIAAELFRAVDERLRDPRDRALLTWLEDALKVLRIEEQPTPDHPASRAWFGPGDAMVETLEALVRGTRSTLDLAVFTLTDNRLTSALLSAHQRGVRVRILTDDDKAHDSGSDAFRLLRAGVPLRFDQSPHHFHHKFAVLDGTSLVNGSYNWTRGADRDNRENFLLTYEHALVARYSAAFASMWDELAP